MSVITGAGATYSITGEAVWVPTWMCVGCEAAWCLISATFMRIERRSCRCHCRSRRSRRLAAGPSQTRTPSDVAPARGTTKSHRHNGTTSFEPCRIHLFLQQPQLESELLNSLVIFSWFWTRVLINLLYLRSLHSFHFVLTSNLRISKIFLLSWLWSGKSWKLQLCNVLNVVRIKLDRYRTKHTLEQQCGTVKRVFANGFTTVCIDAMTRISTDSSGTEAERTTHSTKCVQNKRSADFSESSLNRTAGWRGKVAEWEHISVAMKLGQSVSYLRLSINPRKTVLQTPATVHIRSTPMFRDYEEHVKSIQPPSMKTRCVVCSYEREHFLHNKTHPPDHHSQRISLEKSTQCSMRTKLGEMSHLPTRTTALNVHLFGTENYTELEFIESSNKVCTGVTMPLVQNTTKTQIVLRYHIAWLMKVYWEPKHPTKTVLCLISADTEINLSVLISAKPRRLVPKTMIHARQSETSHNPRVQLTLTITMTHSEKSNQRQSAWPFRREWRGHNPAKKNLLRLCA